MTLPVSFSPKNFRSVLISLRRYESATIGERKDIKTGGVDNTPKKTTYGVSPIKSHFLEIYLLNARRELSVSLQNGALEVLGLESFLRVLSW